MGTITPRVLTDKHGQVYRVRTAVVDDAAALIEHVRRGLVDGEGIVATYDEFDFTEVQERKWIEEHGERPTSIAIVAEAEGDVVGLINFKGQERKRLGHVGSFGVGVHPGFRGRGIGRGLVEALLEWTRNNPEVEKVALAVRADNPRAIALYRKLGFVEEGRRHHEVKLENGEYVDDVLMYQMV